jgi:gluconolactonase
VVIVDESFNRYRLPLAKVERLATGCRWCEGPVWLGDARSLVWSDIPNNRMLRWDDTSGATSVFRAPSNNSNGLARDRQGRLLACEHLTRRITRTEYDGRITVLADRFEGARLNSPNDIVCARDGGIWFTDPSFGIASNWEGDSAPSERPHAVYRIDPASGALACVIDDMDGPNGLAFSPDESRLYVIESRAVPRRIWAIEMLAGGQLGERRVLIEASDHGALDGMAVDREGHLWCGYGSNGSPQAYAGALDGVRIYAPDGTPIGHIHLPERCANVCFGGAKNNRLFMAASHSLYALYVNAAGAV